MVFARTYEVDFMIIESHDSMCLSFFIISPSTY